MEAAHYPCLRPGLVILPAGDGLLIEGAAKRQWLRGQSARDLLPRLLPILDGSHDLESIAAELPITPAHAAKAIAVLQDRGLVQDSGARAAPSLLSRPSLLETFLARAGTTGDLKVGGKSPVRSLTEATVAVAGQHAVRDRLLVDLADLGLRSLSLSDVNHSVPQLGRTPLLVVAFVTPADDEEITIAAEQRAHDLGAPCLRVLASDEEIQLGPRFQSPYTACPACLLESSLEDHRYSTCDLTLPGGAALALAGAVATAEVLRHVAKVGSTVRPDGWTRIGISDWSQETMLVSRRPGCTRCSPLPYEGETPRRLAYVYEQSIVRSARGTTTPRYRLAAEPVPRANKAFPTSPRTSLPREPSLSVPCGSFRRGRLAGIAAPQRSRLDLTMCAAILMRIAGVRNDHSARTGANSAPSFWAPTGGNLGSVQVYCVAQRVAELPQAVSFYDGASHELVAVAPDTIPADYVPTVPAIDPGWTVLFILTAALHHVGRKYGEFAYRLVHLDAGCALAQLRVVSAGYGVEVLTPTRWQDDRLAALLGLDQDQEPITGVAALYSEGASDTFTSSQQFDR